MHFYEGTVPVVMSFSASDPSGGAGIQADVEAIGSMGCHCTPIITAVTAQDTTNIFQFYPCPGRLVRDQARAILEDIPIAAFKIGILGSIDNICTIHQILKDYPEVPVVLDPTLHLGSEVNFLDSQLQEAMIALILPLVTICTPNASEARMMAPGADTLDACAQEIMAQGADYVLITGNHQFPTKTTNTFYGNYRRLEVFQWERLENQFQGAGCTLSACIASLLGQGLSPFSAVYQAQEYTMECLKRSYRLGMGQHLPNRLFWARDASLQYDASLANDEIKKA